MLSIKIFVTQRKYFASAFLYSCFSLIFSTWVTYIPYVAEKIDITEGKIGTAIFFAAIGSFFMIPIARKLVDRFDVGPTTYWALIIFCITLYGPFLAFSFITLCISLFIFGASASLYAISLNSLNATIEKQDKVYIMSGSHGFWSIGGIIGAGGGSFLASTLKSPFIHISLIVLLVIGIQTYLHTEYYFRRGEHQIKEKDYKKNIRPLFAIALVGLVLMVAEGAIADWSALYLKKIIQVPLKYIGMGYATFSFAMMIGRFSGDSLSKKLGSWRLLTYSSLLSIIGFLLVLVLQPYISLFGFFIIGLGFSVIIPEVYRLASNIEGIRTSDGVSYIAASSNIGFLVGPVLLGFIAELKSLHVSFMVLTVFVSLAFFISFWMNKRGKKLI